jgi:hypothetical protein
MSDTINSPSGPYTYMSPKDYVIVHCCVSCVAQAHRRIRRLAKFVILCFATPGLCYRCDRPVQSNAVSSTEE